MKQTSDENLIEKNDEKKKKHIGKTLIKPSIVSRLKCSELKNGQASPDPLPRPVGIRPFKTSSRNMALRT